MLAFAQQPGVVELAGVDESQGQLSTVWAPGGSLESSTIDLATSARVLATVAATVADLHDRGIVHGRLQPGHVLLGSNSEAWLTGFAEASLDGRADRLVDLRAMASLINYVVGRHGPGPRTVPPRPSTGHRSPGASRARLAHDLQQIARRAEQPAGEPQCSIREVARLLRETADMAGASPSPGRSWRRPSNRILAIAGTTAAVLLVGSLTVSRGHSGPPAAAAPTATDPPATSTPATDTTATTTTPTATTATAAAPVSEASASPGAPPAASTRPEPQCASAANSDHGGVDVDGDGCPDPVVIDHGVVTVGAQRYRLSTEPNDQVLVADWDCDGIATPVILRTRTGAIEVFDTWATATTPATARPVTIDPAVVMLRSSGGRCPELSATKTDGTTAVVSLTP
ncbi:MAG: hypothetical protein JWL70_3171 [Acidimicrobiia bacterium]|nr:hypothetical protein [Acidimicrobiia bacterium]